jgi:integrase
MPPLAPSNCGGRNGFVNGHSPGIQAERQLAAIGLDSTVYGTHTMRRTKATLIYKRTKNLRPVKILLGHTKLESTVRYLGIEVDDALEISEQTEI